MAWGFLDWVRGRPYVAESEKLRLSSAPTVRELRAMTLRLLEDDVAYDAYRLLNAHPNAARPVLESLLRDDARFRSMTETSRSWNRPRFDAVLSILFEWKSERAVEEALTLVASADPALRAIAGRLLASTGEARFGSVLLRLTEDSDAAVRISVGRGLSDLLEYGELHNRRFDEALASTLYDYMRDCALRTDAGPGHEFAAMLLRVDPARAFRDFSSDDALSIDRIWLSDILRALHDANITIPLNRITSLLDDAVAIVDRDDFNVRQHFDVGGRITELLCLLSEYDPNEARGRTQSLSAHPQAEARGAAQDARERLSVAPWDVACDALGEAGSIEGMRHEHRVVYLVWILECEVANGGWLQWVANPWGETAEQTLAALCEIGADAAADELRKVMAALGPDGSSPEQADRMNAIDRMMTENRSLPDDGTLWKMSTQLRALLCDYAQRHPQAFER